MIIPALNEAEQIEAAIVSAREAGAGEVLVADGGSQDETLSRALAAGAVTVSSPCGRSAQQNRAARQATGDVLLFLHADCRLPSTAAEQVAEVLGDARVVAGAFRQRIDAKGFGFRLLESGNAWRASWLRRPYGDQGLFVRKAVFQRLGGFPEVRFLEDLLLVRCLRTRGRLVLLPGPLLVSARRWQRHGLCRQTLRNWCILLAEKLGVSPDRLASHYGRHDRREGARSG